MTCFVRLNRSEGTITHAKRGWGHSFPIEDLPLWLTFYQWCRDRANGRYAAHYSDDVRQLERVQGIIAKEGRAA